MTRPSIVFADGLPLAFGRFELTIPIDTAGAGPRRRVLTLDRQVVRFPGG